VKRVLCALGAIAFVAVAFGAVERPRPTVILISLDGWRWDYHSKAPVENLRRLMEPGVRAEGLIPSFPSKTFPNHYTLVTGLYPGHHGVIANRMRDPRSARLFTLTPRVEVGEAMWWGGEPIWVTLQRAGGRSAPMFWPGSEAPIKGERPTYWLPYDHGMANDDRVDRVLAWLDLPPGDRPSFLTLYFSDVDSAGHTYGPASTELVRALEQVDRALGRLLRGLESRGLRDSINIVVTSDHGMAETSRQRVVFIDDYVTADDGDVIDLNPTLGFWPRAGREAFVYRKLSAAHPRLTVYRKAETPSHWHYRDHERIPPIVGVVDEGWSVMRRADAAAAFGRNVRRIGGNHGYDPHVGSMQGVFVASGPAFRSKAVVPAFENVHVYNLLCLVLGIEPAPNDGDRAVALSVLR